MNWPRCSRVVSVAVPLAVATILGVALLFQSALAASQTWYITDTASGSNYVMQRGSTGGTSTIIAVANGASVILVADEAASISVYFAAGDWTGQIKATPDSSGHNATVEIGSWNGTSFTSAGTSGTMTFPTKGVTSTLPFTITNASAFNVSRGDWLALRFNNLVGNKTIDVATDGVSYVSSPSTDTGYPGFWESYKEEAHTTVWGTVGDPYDTGTETVFVYGEAFEASQPYNVGFYDPSVAPNIVATTSPSSDASGTLSTQYLLTTDPLATPGTWHAVVYKDPDTPPDTYDSGDAAIVADDDFEVALGAIPEFPTVIAGIAVAGLCAAIYFWMRRRAVDVKA